MATAVKSDTIPICFTWTGPSERSAPHSPLFIRHIDLLIQDAVSSPISLLVSVVIPEGSSSSHMTSLPFICERRLKTFGNALLKTTEQDRLELTAEQIRNLSIRAVFFEPPHKNLARVDGRLERRIEKDCENLLRVPEKLIPGHTYCLRVTATEDLSLLGQLVEQSLMPAVEQTHQWRERLIAVLRKAALPAMITAIQVFCEKLVLFQIEITLLFDIDANLEHVVVLAMKFIREEVEQLKTRELQSLNQLICKIADSTSESLTETDPQLKICTDEFTKGLLTLFGKERLTHLARAYLTDFVQDRPIPPFVASIIELCAKKFSQAFEDQLSDI